MGKVLVIGASGQLGSVVLDQLLEDGQECVAFVRPSSRFRPPDSQLLQVAYGDLADFISVDNACENVKKVIATAGSSVPLRGDKFMADEVRHYQHLITACLNHKVEHLVYISAFSSPYDGLISAFPVKRQIEQLIMMSGIPYTIFRGGGIYGYLLCSDGKSLSDSRCFSTNIVTRVLDDETIFKINKWIA